MDNHKCITHLLIMSIIFNSNKINNSNKIIIMEFLRLSS